MRGPSKAAGDRGIDRRPQNLPVPLGDMAPVHAERTGSRPRRLVHLMPTLGGAVGIVAAAAGVLVVATRGPTPVYALDGRVHAGDSVLTMVSSTPTSVLFDGDAAYEMTTRDGAVVATAAWGAGSGQWSGSCTMAQHAAAILESCTFDIHGSTTTSLDSYDLTRPGAWHRVYADGQQATIGVPREGAVVPVPFPIGR